MIPNEQRASFTIFEDADGYWFVPSSNEADPAMVKKPAPAVTYPTKIAACRAALEIAALDGATELHLFGIGSTASIKKEAKQKGITPFVYLASIRSRIAPYVPRRSMPGIKFQ